MFASESLVCWVWNPHGGCMGLRYKLWWEMFWLFLIHAVTVSLEYDFEILWICVCFFKYIFSNTFKIRSDLDKLLSDISVTFFWLSIRVRFVSTFSTPSSTDGSLVEIPWPQDVFPKDESKELSIRLEEPLSRWWRQVLPLALNQCRGYEPLAFAHMGFVWGTYNRCLAHGVCDLTCFECLCLLM